jgi:hypothetical protein
MDYFYRSTKVVTKEQRTYMCPHCGTKVTVNIHEPNVNSGIIPGSFGDLEVPNISVLCKCNKEMMRMS